MKLRAGFVGTGYISEYHLAAVRRLNNVELVGVFDVDQEKSHKWAESANTRAYSSLSALREAGAEVMHVLTPPHAHAAIVMEALRLGCHVFVEKPLALDTAECDGIVRAADQSGRKVCVSHSLLFDPQVIRALETVRRGRLGRVVAVDILRSSVYPSYPGGPLPPQYRSASYPFRDLGIHALYLFEAFLGPIENVSATWASIGGDPNLAFDEWRALVRCRDGLGQFQLSWNVRPLQSQIIIQGTKGVLRIDLFLMSQGLRAALPLPKAVERVANALSDSVPMFFDVPRNALRFLTKRALPYHGLQNLIQAFYEALAHDNPAPVLPQDARSTVYWTEKISRAAELEHEEKLRSLRVSRFIDEEKKAPIVITGAAGNLGGAVARALQNAGQGIRLFVRRPPLCVPANAEIVVGNLGDPESVSQAIRGASVVIHAGAAMSGPWPEHECATITGTKNVLEACRKFGVQKLVYVSSMSVLDWAGSSPDSILDETSPYEPRADERGFYTRAKLAAERLVADYAARHAIPTVILRPGKIFGERQPLLSAAIGWKLKGRWIILGNGEVRIPFVYIDDVVDAVLSAARCEACRGEVIQITDPVQLTQNDALRLCEGERVRTLHIPRWMVYALAASSQLFFRLLKRQSPVSVYRMRSALARRRFRNLHVELLGWQPRVGVPEGIRRELQFAQQARDPVLHPSNSVTESEDATQTALK
jgi:predicted dehydrogenase/nucleoside-diphosphate-sugar epimerase